MLTPTLGKRTAGGDLSIDLDRLIYPAPGQVVALPVLFLEGA